MSIDMVNVRGQVMSVLYRTLMELVTQPGGWSSAEQRHREKAWTDVKVLWELRTAWLKDGYSENEKTRSELLHWHRLLSAVLDPQAR
jgi:hypothetical protein